MLHAPQHASLKILQLIPLKIWNPKIHHFDMPELARSTRHAILLRGASWSTSLSSSYMVTESRTIRWAEHVAGTWNVRNSYKILFGKPVSKKIVSNDNTTMDLEETRWMQFPFFCKGYSNVLFKRLIERRSKVLGKMASVTDVWKYMEKLWNHKDKGKPKYLERNPSHCHIIYHKSHMVWPGTERGPPWSEAGDWQPELIGRCKSDTEQSRSLKWSFFTSQATGLLRLSRKCYKTKRHILVHPHLTEVPQLDYPLLLRQQ